MPSCASVSSTANAIVVLPAPLSPITASWRKILKKKGRRERTREPDGAAAEASVFAEDLRAFFARDVVVLEGDVGGAMHALEKRECVRLGRTALKNAFRKT